MFAMHQKVLLTLTPDVRVSGAVTKVSYTEQKVWYSVKLDSGVEVHGIEAVNLTPT